MLINSNSDYGFNWTEISYRDFYILNSFSAFSKLNFNQESALAESKNELEETINSIRDYNKGGEQESIESYIHHITSDDEMLIDEMQRLQRYSIITSIFSFYEAQLKSLCEIIEEEFNFKIKIKDLNNYKGDLVKYWTYLNNVYEMETKISSKLFEPLNRQKIIRNIIVHHDGIANEDMTKKIPNSKGITLRKVNDYYIIEIEENEYVEFLLLNIKEFFKALFKEIDIRYTQLKL